MIPILPAQSSSTLPMEWVSTMLTWYTSHHRPLPWRLTPSPYRTWISEVMSQQTQLGTVVPYFDRFTQQIPDIPTLAAVDQNHLLKLWEGLGYYRRAINLQTAAQQMMEHWNGALPTTYHDLQSLSGVGPYVAAAIASIAFEQPIPVVDGNVLRVFTRFWGIELDIRLPKTKQYLFDALLPHIHASGHPSYFNQAMMEIGALRCHPQSPQCSMCPLSEDCVAFQQNRTASLPVKSKKSPTPHYTIGVGVILHHGHVVIGQRPVTAMLGGLYEFPGGKQWPNEPIESTVIREINEETGLCVTLNRHLATIQHAYTHFKITMIAHECAVSPITPSLPDLAPPFQWVPIETLPQYPFPKANLSLLKHLLPPSPPQPVLT